MLIVFVIFALLVILLYSGTMVWLYASFRRSQEPLSRQEKQLPFHVSLIIPVRNEAMNLRNLFSDLSHQEPPLPEYEVIFVDDHSTDRSGHLLEEVCREHVHYRWIRLPESVTGKKHAIAAGIEAATGDWIIQADADCRLPASFISGHMGYAIPGVDLVAGPVVVRPGKSNWGRLEALEHFSMTATSLAAAAAGRPVMCSGANLSYSKRSYQAVSANLLATPHVSGDDVFLLSEAKKRKMNIVFTSVPGMLVTTSPTQGPLAFLRQRIRWGSKAKYYTDPDMVALSILVWLANTTLAGLLLFSLSVGGMVWIFLSALVIKSLSEYLMLHRAAERLGQKQLLRIFPVAALFYYFYIALAGIFSMAGAFTWKGRRHHRI